MSREQIEEMAKVLIDYTNKNHIMASHVILEDYAESLYKQGYRKQSEGEWIEHETAWGDTYYSCSACGDERCTIDGTIYEHDFYYCPNCGAKMKGGAE